ncbi:hypothetical protein H310_05424 [Aphanomyces invadans]|uniref:DUF4286 family protein n=1 Tax=Aphanomyces invadans TaxID=157072 RepID=A0A024U9P0_9STRA|nr:hypothetical protein H310_05424 [Aphanomyces invadans]ETW02984.1 hypothetical protein H310_05424 [Aphanomyces invadans]RHY22213.1 hypothetical protein DYB32_009574 [Aphanomyces invadans]|eukprot:XP_008868368.1 hypothetical protein H310_05424 [Aphanomyces invadans]
MTVVYEVLVRCEETVADRLSAYMTGRHLPDILNTGCFASIEFEQSAAGVFRTRYKAATQADLDRYLAEHTAAMRDDFMAHFPTGVLGVERVNWTHLVTLDAAKIA